MQYGDYGYGYLALGWVPNGVQPLTGATQTCVTVSKPGVRKITIEIFQLIY